jgi:hypothetical protein
MAVLSWGKPKVEIGLVGPNGSEPTQWKVLPEIVADSTQLTSEAGEKIEATEEGGGIVDSRRKANTYSLALTLFVKKGDEKPIADIDGIIEGNYAVRLTPEDPTTEGFVMDKTAVSVTETWNSADGKRWAYTFDGLKPKSGAVLKPYTASEA